MPFLLHFRLIVGATVLAIAIAPATAADFNVAVAARVITFRQPAPAKLITVAVIFDPNDAESTAEAAAIEKRVGGGIDTGKTLIRVRRLPVAGIGGLSGTSVAFVTSSLRDHHQEIAAVAQRGGILTITSDLACVAASRCAVAISSGSKTQITVNRAACKAARVQFGSAFLMLVKEL